MNERQLLLKIYKHFFWTGHKYRRKEMKEDIETVLNLPVELRGNVYKPQKDITDVTAAYLEEIRRR